MSNGPFIQATLLKKSCLKSKANKQDLAKQKEQAKQSLLLVLKKKPIITVGAGANSKTSIRFKQTVTAEFTISNNTTTTELGISKQTIIK